jgi:sRNA-binding regulator protein Hfq
MIFYGGFMVPVIKRDLQNEILNLLMNEHKLVEFHFVGNSNVKSTRGVIISFDEFRINIDSFGRQLSVYKQSVSHISSLAGGRSSNRNRPRFVNNNTRNTPKEIRTWNSSEQKSNVKPEGEL